MNKPAFYGEKLHPNPAEMLFYGEISKKLTLKMAKHPVKIDEHKIGVSSFMLAHWLMINPWVEMEKITAIPQYRFQSTDHSFMVLVRD